MRAGDGRRVFDAGSRLFDRNGIIIEHRDPLAFVLTKHNAPIARDNPIIVGIRVGPQQQIETETGLEQIAPIFTLIPCAADTPVGQREIIVIPGRVEGQ